MLKRIITAAVLIGIFAPLFLIGGKTVYGMVAVVGFLGFYELTSMIKLPLALRIFVIVSFEAMLFMDTAYLMYAFFAVTFILMICAIWDEKVNVGDVFMMSSVCTFVCFCAHSFMLLGLRNNFYMLGLSLITYLNDSGAYFGGRYLGQKFFKNKFNERVSPKKTWEGAIAGFASAIVTAIVVHCIWPNLFVTMPNALIIGTVLGVTGQMGDLMFSLIKRHYDVKDYGNLLPGHGGALDRVDSLLVNFAVALVLLEILL